MNSGQLQFVGPLSPIIGAIVGAVITVAVTYFFVIKRKALTFWVTETENLTRSLQGHHEQIVVSVGGQGFLNLNRATVRVKNTGDVSVEGLRFEIEIPGEHQGYLANVVGGDAELRKSVTISMDQPVRSVNPTFHVDVATFVNAKEMLAIAVFFDGEPTKCNIRCRLVDVRVRVKTGAPLGLKDFIHLGSPVEVIMAVAAILLGITILGGLLSALSKFVFSFSYQFF